MSNLLRRGIDSRMVANERVENVMSRPALSIDSDESIGAALDLFATRPFHHLPILNRGEVIGLLTPIDLLNYVGCSPNREAGATNLLKQTLKRAKLQCRPVITIAPHASLAEAARTMIAHAIHALPVVDEQTQLLGMITTTDIMGATLSAPNDNGAQSPRARSVDAPPETNSGGVVQASQERVQHPQDIADAMMLLQRRRAVLERVLFDADRYLNRGQDPPLRAAIRKAISEAKRPRADGGTSA